MAGADVIAGIVQGAANSIYGIYQDQRDNRYKRELQQTIFDREDSAIQRRVADLKAAGLNPNLAAQGSGAGAGSVVTSSSKDVNFGNVLDTLSASEQLKQQKEETKRLKNENDAFGIQKRILQQQELQQKLKTYMANMEYDKQWLYNEWLYGNDVGSVNFNDNSGILGVNDGGRDGSYVSRNFKDMPLYQMWTNELANSNNNASLLQFDADTIDTDWVMKMFGEGGKIVLPLLQLLMQSNKRR